MGQDPLRRIAVVAALAAFGVVSELVARPGFGFATLDLGVGVVGAAGGAFAFAVAWFVGTLAGSGAYLVLLYRAPLLQLLLDIARPQVRLYRTTVCAAYAAVLLPFGVASAATVVVALACSASVLDAARRATAASRGASHAAAAASGLLGLVWALAAARAFSDAAALIVVDAATLATLAIVIATSSGLWSREAERALVVDLGSTRHHDLPLTRRIAHALADPALEIRYRLPDGRWVNELGREVASPETDATVTHAPAPGGGEVTLVHGEGTSPPARLARSAAAAAALSLESARLDAEVRARSREVDDARRRLLTAADDERRALEERLSEDVLGRLHHVDRLLHGNGFEPEREQLRGAVGDLIALARGLYPPALARQDLGAALGDLARQSSIPVMVDAADDLEPLPEAKRAAAWFFCSESLANVERHANASSARVVARRTGAWLTLEVTDDGSGGARVERGLRGLADRIDALGGRIDLSSPDGGPTVLRAWLPLDT